METIYWRTEQKFKKKSSVVKNSKFLKMKLKLILKHLEENQLPTVHDILIWLSQTTDIKSVKALRH